MLVSIGRRSCVRCCLQRRSSPWPVLRPQAAPAPPASSSSSSSAACWPAVSRAYSSRTNSRNGGATTNTTTNNSTSSSSSARQNRPPATIAVLGGGVTGLTTAYYLTKFLPSARITLYEASDRLGGWVDSHTMDLHKRLTSGMPARVVCEYGPRLITPTEKNFSEMLVYAELLHHLNLMDKTWTLHKPPIGSRQADPLSRRYIYYPDHLVELPGPRSPPSPS
ncbi:protoporphyrinogen oxidase [Magnaporthiopsis poae ATCC 64411]|uniref:Protoporphyrinogen oxidase n=1 Tax=Magnaporthiopsis poae (strain ATCC 64411 / 73-15) TaxID=644358 RepID=A0A0C4EAH1_MAGP6|nr:protoporphyrinogen oxidase [Magnaporthiopsis poae ATCC 64411]